MNSCKQQNIVIRSAARKNTSKKQISFLEGERLQAAVDETSQAYFSLCRRTYASQNHGQVVTEDEIRGIARKISPATLTVLDEVAKLIHQAYAAIGEGQDSIAENAIAVGDELIEQTVLRIARLETEAGSSKSAK